MYKVSASTDVNMPEQAVWDLYCDAHRYAEFAHATERMVDVPEGPMGEGYTYKEYGGVGPFKSESEWTVTEFEPTTRQVHLGSDGTMRFVLEIDIEPTSTGCRITQRFSVEPRGAMKVGTAVLWPLFMRRALRRAMRLTVANVKEIAEATLSS